jgi:hypothetical protein
MENKFKYRPEIQSIDDLQPGDEFLVGDERWPYERHAEGCIVVGGVTWGSALTQDFIRANVPIERNIPYPEGGEDKWELREGDPGKPRTEGSFVWGVSTLDWQIPYKVEFAGFIYAIPKAKPAPKEYTVQFDGHFPGVGDICHVPVGEDFKPGDRVTVQRVEK